jgi:hypothetical protein
MAIWIFGTVASAGFGLVPGTDAADFGFPFAAGSAACTAPLTSDPVKTANIVKQADNDFIGFSPLGYR